MIIFLRLSNLVQTFSNLYASVRTDFGNRNPNNFLTNPATINTTLLATFPATEPLLPSTSAVLLMFSQPKGYLAPFLPLCIEGLARIQVV
jgi:hypothetical protein